MKYFVFTLRYSQTDHENVIVQANSSEEAREKISHGSARYIDGGYEARMVK